MQRKRRQDLWCGLQGTICLINIALTATAVQQNRFKLKYNLRDPNLIGINGILATISSTGPEQYPLVFTILMLSIMTLLLYVRIALAGRREPWKYALPAECSIALTWTGIFIFSTSCFIILSGPPSRVGCGYGVSNLASFGHGYCTSLMVDYGWFACSVVLFLTSFYGMVSAIDRFCRDRQQHRVQILEDRDTHIWPIDTRVHEAASSDTPSLYSYKIKDSGMISALSPSIFSPYPNEIYELPACRLSRFIGKRHVHELENSSEPHNNGVVELPPKMF